jgi:hypothetical protein
MPRRYFTVGEVNRLIPTLQRIFTSVHQLRAAMRGEEERLEKAGVRLSQDVLEGEGSPRDPVAVRRAKLMFRGYYETLTEQLAGLETIGAEVKDLDLGLVDFPARRGSEEILLCWRFGESQVGFWHSVEGGYRGRRPIDDEVPLEPPGLD